MNADPLAYLLASPVLILAGVVAFLLPRRLRMERRARQLLAEYPEAEQTTVYLQFHSISWKEKQKAHDTLVAEMASKGWTFLKGSEANLLRTSMTWAGGVNMHFIRNRPAH